MTRKTSLRIELGKYQTAIRWYASIVTWLLNRAENTPLAIKELIREANMKHVIELCPKKEEKGSED